MAGTTQGDGANPHVQETIFDAWGPLKSARRKLVSRVFRIPDTGWFGLTPLRTHILICGYQRAGTTLLLAMLEHGFPNARRFGRETSGWRAATYSLRNHAVMISKVPNDILKLHRLRNFYQKRKAKLKIIILVRDPRDVLTSSHASHDRTYFQNIDEWRMFHEHFRQHRAQPDVLVVKYEQLVNDVDAAQNFIEQFTQEVAERPFSQFHAQRRDDFDSRPLNGVRPADNRSIGRWARPEHRERIECILQRVPDLPDILIELGYETDSHWIERWRQDASGR